MANSAQARKRARQAIKARAHNMSLRSRLRTAIKAVRKAVDGGDKSAAQQVFVVSQRTIDSIADKKIIHGMKDAVLAPCRARDEARALAANYVVEDDIALLHVPNHPRPFDKTELLLLGQEKATVSVVLDAYALRTQRAITIPLIKAMLESE